MNGVDGPRQASISCQGVSGGVLAEIVDPGQI